MSQVSLYSQHLAKLLPKVGTKDFCPLLAADINPGTAFPSGNHPGGRFFGPRYYVSRRGELRRALGEHVHGCNNP